MNGAELSYLVNSLSFAIVDTVSDDDVTLLACIFAQLSDTLITIQTQNSLFNNQAESSENNEQQTKQGLPI